MAYTFLTPQNIFKRYDDAKAYTDKLTIRFPEFARIARNEPMPNLENYPKVTDGTTAGIIQKTPKNVVQQLPTGVVKSDKDTDWLPIVAQFIYENEILPYANEDYGFLEKCHLIMEGGLTFGAQATFRRFAKHRNGFGPDAELIYWGDIAIQKGKKSGRGCDYIFYRTWWQPGDVKALIADEKARAKAAKKRKDTYEATWDTETLSEVLNFIDQKDQQAYTPSEKERGVQAEGIELITGFQRGAGNKFYTFHRDTQKIVRTKVNNDPRGEMPIDWFYGGIDGANPLGRGIPEQIGSLQNLIDARMQMQQYAATYGLNPAVIEYGDADTNFEYLPNKVIHTDNPNYKVEAVSIDTSALADFTQTQQYLQSQLYQLVNNPHTNVPSSSSVTTDGKTPAAINLQQATLDIDMNAVEKHFEAWFQSWSEGAINQWFAERSGKEILQLDSKTANRLRDLPPSKDFDPNQMLDEQNQLIIDYDTATPALQFRVDPSTTRVKSSADQVQDATNLLDLVMKYPMLDSAYGGPIDREVLARRIVVNSGIEDPEQVAPEPTEAQKVAKEQAKNSPSPFSPMFDKPSIRINFPDLPPAAQVQVLGMAGVQITEQDVLQGPVVDPNVRGVMNPVSPPNVLLPGGGQNMPQPTTNPLQPDGINLTPQEISRLQNDPRFAQAQPAQPAGVTQQHIAELKALGVPDNQIAQAVRIYNQRNGITNG